MNIPVIATTGTLWTPTLKQMGIIVPVEGFLMMVARVLAEKTVKSPKASKACETLLSADLISLLNASDILPSKKPAIHAEILSYLKDRHNRASKWLRKKRRGKKAVQQGNDCSGCNGHSGLLGMLIGLPAVQ